MQQGQNKMLLIGGGAVVALIAVYFLFLRGGGDDDLASSLPGNVNVNAQTVAAVQATAAAVQTQIASAQAGVLATAGAGAAAPTATRPAAAATVAPVQPTTAPSTGAATGGGDFGAVNRAFANVRSYQVDVTSTAAGQTFQISVQVGGPDTYKATVSGGPLPIEVIGIGTQTYLKLGPTWQVAPASTLPIQPSLLLSQTESYVNSTIAQKGGTKNVGGATCQVWTVTAPAPATSKAEVCIGSDNLPREITFTDGASTGRMVYSNYNANFNITKPIP